MTTPARMHFQKSQAEKSATHVAEHGSMRDLNVYEQQLLQLNTDKNRLKGVQSIQNKVELKRQLISAYKPYIEGILTAKPAVQDAIVSEILVWAIDIQDFEYALILADYVLKYGLKLPDRFDRTEACYITEEIAEAYLKTLKTDAEIDITVLERLSALVTDPSLSSEVRDMPDEVKSKLYLALGKAEMRSIKAETQDDLAHAVKSMKYLAEAVKLNDKCGGKTDLAKMEKLVTSLGEQHASTESDKPENGTPGNQQQDDSANNPEPT